ncbi:major capsid protein [Tortoise microvirus 82]|nr:major capsid protein [Tortoise microvirus 82]
MSGGMNRTMTTPVPVQRTTRRHDLRILTSLPAGKMVPLGAVPLLREDALTRLQARITFEMSETVEMLMNAVNVRVMAYLVPHLAYDRFSGMDELNRSYEGVANQEGGTPTPFFQTMAAPAHGANQVLTYMGKHARPGTTINAAYIEAYNKIWNFRAKNRSPDITQRGVLDGTLAPAFWSHSAFSHIVPDFDQAIIDGQVALNVVNSRMPVRGLGLRQGHIGAAANIPVNNTDAEPSTIRGWAANTGGTGDGTAHIVIKQNPNFPGSPEVWAEMQQDGITISLSNIDMARRTQAFAELRRRYNGHDDEYIIDLLMDGIAVPEQAWRQPMLLADQMTVFGMSKRYASDAGNLTESVVNGETFIDITARVPQCPTGGVVMLVAEITPEQLFERGKDPYLHATAVAQLPHFLRDTLDPEKVSVVPNDYVDLDHDVPNATFGYAPLGYEWNLAFPQIGGRFYRPTVDAAFDEDRQRIWAVETQNPVLSQDFYLCTTMHQKPFVVTNQDPFEAVVRGGAVISGNTVFGGALIEATNDYAEVVAEQPTARIAKP